MAENLIYYKVNTDTINTLFGIDFKNGGIKTIKCSNEDYCRKYGFLTSEKCSKYCPVIEKVLSSIFPEIL